MASKNRKSGLGKGLEALFVDNTTDESNGSLLKITEIEPNKEQPRKEFEESSLGELADSIREHGVLQPLLVRPLPNGRYQIVAGERRWRASRMAGLSEVPVVIREMSDLETMELALIENLQREDLNAIEEAQGYRTLMETYQMTQEQVAQRVGKSRPAVANALRLLSLPESVEAMVRDGKISSGHGRALLGLEEDAAMEELAARIEKEGLSVREVEKIVSKLAGPEKKSRKKAGPEEEAVWGKPFFKEMELALAQELHRKVKIETKKNKGTIQLEFYSEEELAEIAQRLTNTKLFLG